MYRTRNTLYEIIFEMKKSFCPEEFLYVFQSRGRIVLLTGLVQKSNKSYENYYLDIYMRKQYLNKITKTNNSLPAPLIYRHNREENYYGQTSGGKLYSEQ